MRWSSLREGIRGSLCGSSDVNSCCAGVLASDCACTISKRGFSEREISSLIGVCNVSTGLSGNVDWKRLEIGARRLRARSWRPVGCC
jgi:hypothetical protein